MRPMSAVGSSMRAVVPTFRYRQPCTPDHRLVESFGGHLVTLRLTQARMVTRRPRSAAQPARWLVGHGFIHTPPQSMLQHDQIAGCPRAVPRRDRNLRPCRLPPRTEPPTAFAISGGIFWRVHRSLTWRRAVLPPCGWRPRRRLADADHPGGNVQHVVRHLQPRGG